MIEKNVLITGATGFVGAHLLNKLIHQDDISEVYLTSRNVNKNAFMEDHQSILSVLDKYGLNSSKEKIRKIKIIYGDISEPKIGMHEILYHELASRVDTIYHVAAEVHHLKKYEELKKSNVDSVMDIINFAKDGKNKIVNFVSTMGSASKRDAHGKFVEDFPDYNSDDANITMGYLKSKYEAEKILAKPENKDFVNIFRLGYISGSIKSGVGLYENNQLMLFIKSCIQMGYAPKIERVLNLTPVDFTSDIVGSKYFRSNSKHVMHLVNCRQYVTWSELIDFLNDEGFCIKKIDLPSWQELLKKSGRDNALYRMLLTYRRSDADNHIIRFGKNINEYHMDNVISFCKDENIPMPQIKYDYLKKIVNYLIEVGFLTKMVC
jgi:thioester reductase-like protein